MTHPDPLVMQVDKCVWQSELVLYVFGAVPHVLSTQADPFQKHKLP
jgi:hypothetical protein